MQDQPTTGGSYTRDPDTGELTRNVPAPPADPDQPATPAKKRSR